MRTRIPIAIAITLAVGLVAAVAAPPPYQVGWLPNNYRVVCPEGATCLGDALHRQIGVSLARAAAAYKATGFNSPVAWGKRKGAGTSDDHIEVYFGSDPATIAHASRKCGNHRVHDSTIAVGAQLATWARRGAYLVDYFLGHELFHLVQYAYPFFDPRSCTPPPGWILEGTADAVALDQVRRRYPSVAPSNRDDREARKFSGLRRYDEPLPARILRAGEDRTSGENIYYYTSSFWRHLAAVHHGGSYKFLDDYFKRTASTGNWVDWLEDNVKQSTGAALGLVFAGFLADYAGWGDPGLPGRFFGRTKWLADAFGGCKQVTLNKVSSSGHLDVALKPIAGACVEVRVAGLEETDSAAVQIAGVIQQGKAHERDGIHLGMALSTDATAMHCARGVKREGKVGLGKCLFVPDDGKVRIGGQEVDARVWNVVAQRRDPKATELRNLYTVSRTPLNVTTGDTRYGGKAAVVVRLYFVLDVTDVTIAGRAKSRTKRTVGHIGSAVSADPQTTLPKRNAAPSYAKPAPPVNLPAVPAVGLGQLAPGKLVTAMVSEDLDGGDGGVADRVALQMMPVRRRGKSYEPAPLAVGQTGSFQAVVSGSVAGDMVGTVAPITLTVDEFSDLVFRASFSGTMCRVQDLRPKQGCANPLPVHGRINKAFAGSRLQGREMVLEDTPGVRLYRDVAIMPGLTPPPTPPAPPDAPTPPGPPITSTSSASGLVDGCDCSCTAYAELQDKLQDVRAGVGSASEVEALVGCISTCSQQYMRCPAPGRGRKAPRRKRP